MPETVAAGGLLEDGVVRLFVPETTAAGGLQEDGVVVEVGGEYKEGVVEAGGFF